MCEWTPDQHVQYQGCLHDSFYNSCMYIRTCIHGPSQCKSGAWNIKLLSTWLVSSWIVAIWSQDCNRNKLGRCKTLGRGLPLGPSSWRFCILILLQPCLYIAQALPNRPTDQLKKLLLPVQFLWCKWTSQTHCSKFNFCASYLPIAGCHGDMLRYSWQYPMKPCKDSVAIPGP